MAPEGGVRVIVCGTEVHGLDVHDDTRCAHYASDRDVVAIAFACCGRFFPCFQCHDALADHEAERWPADATGTCAVLCGVCGHVHAIGDYLDSPLSCAACGTEFNPGCRDHHDRYFQP